MPSGWSVLIAGVHVALTHRRLVMLACIGWEDTRGSSDARSLHLPRHGIHGCHSLPKPTHDKAPLAQSWRRCPARYLHGTSHRCAALNSARLAKQDPTAPSIVAPLCTASSTARSKPDRSLCIRLPAAVFKESSAQGGQGSWRMMRAARVLARLQHLAAAAAAGRRDQLPVFRVPATLPPGCGSSEGAMGLPGNTHARGSNTHT